MIIQIIILKLYYTNEGPGHLANLSYSEHPALLLFFMLLLLFFFLFFVHQVQTTMQTYPIQSTLPL